MKCHVKVLNIAHIAHTSCGIGISNMPENFQKVNCSIGYEASGMGEDTGLCGIDPDDDTRGTAGFFWVADVGQGSEDTTKIPEILNA